MFFKIMYEPLETGEIIDITKTIKKFSVRKVNGVKNNTFSLVLKNTNDYWLSTTHDWIKFQSRGLDVGSKFYFYLSEDDNITDEDLFFTGVLQKVTQPISKNKRILELSGIDNVLVELGKVWSGKYINKTASEIVVSVGKSLFVENPLDYSNVEGTSQNIDLFVCRYEPYYEILERLGSPQYTGVNRQFVFYLKNNQLFWHDPNNDSYNNNVSWELINNKIISKSVGRSTEGAVNHVIFTCGVDKNNVGIQDHYFDPSINRGRTKSVWMNYSFISKQVREKHELLGDYDSMSNEEFRSECIELGRTYAKNLLYGLGNPRFTVELIIKPTLNINNGDLISITSYDDNLHNKKLRVYENMISFDYNRITQKLVLKEDYYTLSIT